MPDRLLDSNAISAAMKADDRFGRYLEQVVDTGATLTSVVVEGELSFGILLLPEGSRRRALRSALDDILKDLDDILPVTRKIAVRYSVLKATMRARGTPMGENDLWIAATALDRQIILVSNDAAFRSIPGLAVEDFSAT